MRAAACLLKCHITSLLLIDIRILLVFADSDSNSDNVLLRRLVNFDLYVALQSPLFRRMILYKLQISFCVPFSVVFLSYTIPFMFDSRVN